MGKGIALSISIIAVGAIFGMSPLFRLNLDKPLNSNYVEFVFLAYLHEFIKF